MGRLAAGQGSRVRCSMDTKLPPYVCTFKDRHGKRRWRFRRKGKTAYLPGEPGSPEFEAAYASALAGRPVPQAEIRRLPTAASPKSLRAAWRILVERTADWQALKPETQARQTAIAERFFAARVVETDPAVYGDLPIADMERRHVKMILAQWSDTPHAAGHILRLIRKLITVALDEEWITTDPTYRLKYRPAYKGWRAWTERERATFEKRWPIGTTPRLVYALTLYTGQRRSDVAVMKWSDIEDNGIHVVQKKTGKTLWIPLHAALVEVLNATERKGDTILVTQYDKPFSDKALGMRMLDWTRSAKLPPGATMHGLRKTLGKLLAEHGATTRQIMDILGHSDIAHAELYTREAEQKRLATDGMRTLAVINGGKTGV